jgi:hypothetical protein
VDCSYVDALNTPGSKLPLSPTVSRFLQPVQVYSPTPIHSGMVFIDNSDGDDDDVPEWVGEINILHGWAEITAAVFVVLTLLLMFTQIGLHLHYNESDAYRIYTIRILVMVSNTTTTTRRDATGRAASARDARRVKRRRAGGRVGQERPGWDLEPRASGGCRTGALPQNLLEPTTAAPHHPPSPRRRLRCPAPRRTPPIRQVPIYSVTSYMGLHDPPNAVIYALIRDCYE